MIHLLILLIPLSFAMSPFAIYENNQGVEAISNGEKLDPNYFNRLIQANSEQWVFYWNQVVANITSEDYATAIQTLKWIISIIPKDEESMRFHVYYQLGRVYAQEKKMLEALEAYQNALDIYPDSKEVTVNIELLAQSGGGGGGGGEDEQKDQNKEQQKQDQNQQQKPQEDKPNQDASGPKPTPKPFDSKDLSKEDVKRILDELKRQEEQIRAKMDDSKPKEKGLGKDW